MEPVEDERPETVLDTRFLGSDLQLYIQEDKENVKTDYGRAIFD